MRQRLHRKANRRRRDWRNVRFASGAKQPFVAWGPWLLCDWGRGDARRGESRIQDPESKIQTPLSAQTAQTAPTARTDKSRRGEVALPHTAMHLCPNHRCCSRRRGRQSGGWGEKRRRSALRHWGRHWPLSALLIPSAASLCIMGGPIPGPYCYCTCWLRLATCDLRDG